MSTVVRSLSLAVILAAAPLTVTRHAGVTASTACAQGFDGTCCEQPNAICNAGGGNNMGYCYKGIGSCAAPGDPAPCG
jgi:hypothetical protein